jgi:uncharacterized protein (DUF58 family)
MITRKFWLLVLLTFLLVFLGLVTLHGGLIALALPLCLYLGAGILYAPDEPRLQAVRTISTDKALQQAPVGVELAVTNQAAILEEVALQDLIPDQLEITQGETGKLLSFAAGDTVRWHYTLRGGRGFYKLDKVQVTVNDHFDLFQTRQLISAPGQVLLLPEAMRLRRVVIRPPQTRGFTGPIPARTNGTGVDFLEVREYQLGDALRKINWRISARNHDMLFTNQFEQERIADVGLILDARQQANLVTREGSLFEYAVRATASLAETFLNDGHRVSLLVYGFGLETVYPGYGKVQQKRILSMLAHASPGSNFALDSLNHLPTRLFSARSQLVLISSLNHEDLQAYVRLRSQGYDVLLISPDPVAFEARNYQEFPGMQYPRRLAQVERRLLLNQLRRIGVRVVDWQVDQPLDRTIHVALAQQPAHQRILQGMR